MPTALAEVEQAAFPKLTEAELAAVEEAACKQTYRDGEVVFRVGQADVDLFVVKSGQIDIINPTDDGSLIIDRVTMLGTWQGSGPKRALNGLNQRPGAQGISLFTPVWGDSTPLVMSGS